MPIFKVVTRDFTRKVLIVCDNLKDLINSSVQRLGLPNVEYSVCEAGVSFRGNSLIIESSELLFNSSIVLDRLNK